MKDPYMQYTYRAHMLAYTACTDSSNTNNWHSQSSRHANYICVAQLQDSRFCCKRYSVSTRDWCFATVVTAQLYEKDTQMISEYVYLDDSEHFWHVVPSMLFDDRNDLSKLLEQVFSHVFVTGPYHAQERRHYLMWKREWAKLYNEWNGNTPIESWEAPLAIRKELHCDNINYMLWYPHCPDKLHVHTLQSCYHVHTPMSASLSLKSSL